MIVIGSMQAHAFIGEGDYSPTLTEAMGKGGGQIPMIVEAYSLTPKRTEYGKAVRKKYESHEIYERRKI